MPSEWLSEVLYALAFKFGGWRAVTVLAATSCAALVGVLCLYLLRHLRFSVAIGWTVLTAAAISWHFYARPHIFSYLLLAVWLVSLLNAYDDKGSNLPSAFTLAPLMILWANLHGSVSVGLALLYIFAGFCLYQSILQRDYRKCRRLLVVTSAVTVCALLTPYGFWPAFTILDLMNMKFAVSHIVETTSPNFQRLIFHLIYLVTIFAAIAGLGIQLRGPRLIVFALIIYCRLKLQPGAGNVLFSCAHCSRAACRRKCLLSRTATFRCDTFSRRQTIGSSLAVFWRSDPLPFSQAAWYLPH